MSGLSNLSARLRYQGGYTTEERMESDKLKSLKSALFNSYQAETAVLEDGRKFKCLINPNKNSPDYDNKVISIPFKDIELSNKSSGQKKTTQGIETLGVKAGDTFLWEETNTHWIIYLQYLEETAYFRAEIRRCDQQVEVNGTKYWVYLRGPNETSLVWNQKGGVEWNQLNYSMVLYITKNSDNIEYFHRFSKVKVIEPETGKKKTWQVVAQNPYYGDGVIQVFIDEYYENTLEEQMESLPEEKIPESDAYISGDAAVSRFDTVTYTLERTDELADWYVISGDVITELDKQQKSVKLDILQKSGKFVLQAKTASQTISKEVTIKSL